MAEEEESEAAETLQREREKLKELEMADLPEEQQAALQELEPIRFERKAPSEVSVASFVETPEFLLKRQQLQGQHYAQLQQLMLDKESSLREVETALARLRGRTRERVYPRVLKQSPRLAAAVLDLEKMLATLTTGQRKPVKSEEVAFVQQLLQRKSVAQQEAEKIEAAIVAKRESQKKSKVDLKQHVASLVKEKKEKNPKKSKPRAPRKKNAKEGENDDGKKRESFFFGFSLSNRINKYEKHEAFEEEDGKSNRSQLSFFLNIYIGGIYTSKLMLVEIM
jgi:uncharacterized protein YifE (UPF0438 family)